MAGTPFTVEEATIGGVHAAFQARELTCRALTEACLARIEAYDKAGPELNAVVTVNPHALDRADELDQELTRTGRLVGPLHGIPVLVKDQVETKDMPTAFGSIACDGYQPAEDATVAARLREAGAVILAKTALPDFATSWFSFSSKSGETKNPYDLSREAGGSSAGTGAGVAANFAIVGIGEDTGGSIRVPGSFNNLVGLRVTSGLISRAGLSPLVVFQDTAGPMGRTVTDVAVMLDVLAGYDPRDPYTVTYAIARPEGSYTRDLHVDGLREARVGVVRQVFGSADDPDSAPVNQVVEAALESLRGAGATVVDPVEIPDLAHYIDYTSLYVTHSKHDINAFLAARAGLPTFEEIYERKQFHPALDLMHAIAGGPADPEEDPEYYKKYAAREQFQRAVVNVMAAARLDALCFPSVQVVPPTTQELLGGRWTTLTFPTNTLIASQTWMPALTVPAGFTGAGLPVGLELVAKPYDEGTLLRLGYAFEQATQHRRAPASTPPLRG